MSPAKSLATKTVIVSACSCLQNRNAASGFPTQYRAARFSGMKPNSRGSLNLWTKCFPVSAWSNLSWAKRKSQARRSVSCCTFFLRMASSIKHQLVLQFLSWWTHCLGVRVASRLFGDEWCVSRQVPCPRSVELDLSGL